MSELLTRHKIDLKDKQFQEAKRDFKVERDGIDVAARTVELSFASNAPVQRWFGNEVLEISPTACDLSRLNNGGAVLVNHEMDDQVGVVIKAWIDGATSKARCMVKFSQSDCGEEIFQDIVDGIRSLVSVGYIVRKMVLQSVEGDVETHRVTDWLPYEVSIVSVPADASVGVGRSRQAKDEPKPIVSAAPVVAVENNNKNNSRKMSEENKTVTAPVADFSAERQRIADLNKTADQLSTRHPQHKEAFFALARKCSETGDNVDAFNRTVLADILKTSNNGAPATTEPAVRQINPMAGMDNKSLKRYNLFRAIQMVLAGKTLDGLEGEMSRHEEKRIGTPAQGFYVPDDVFAYNKLRSKRTLLAGDGPDGAYTISDNILEQELVGYLRNQTVVGELGARTLSGLQGNVSVPRVITGSTVYWTSETGATTVSSPTFGQIAMRPRRVGAYVKYSKDFLSQSALSAQSFLLDDINTALGVELDRVALSGAGGAEPLGILNLATAERSTSVAFGAAATWAKYVDFWTQVATNNALIGNPAYVTTPASAAKAKTIAKFASTGLPIWSEGDTINGYRARVSNQFPTSGTLNQVVFGDFSQVIYGEWVGNDVVVDPITSKTSFVVEIVVHKLVDMVIRRGKSFSISSDSGAQ